MLRNLEPWASIFGTTCGDAPGVLKKFFKNPHRCPMDARSLLLDLRLPSVRKPRQHNHFIVDPGLHSVSTPRCNALHSVRACVAPNTFVPCADCVPRVLDSSFLNPIPAAFPCAATDAEQVHSLMHCKCTRPSAKPRLAGLTVKSKNTSNNGMTKRLASVSLPKAKDTCTCHNGMPKQPTPFHQPCTQSTMLQAHTHTTRNRTHTQRGADKINAHWEQHNSHHGINIVRHPNPMRTRMRAQTPRTTTPTSRLVLAAAALKCDHLPMRAGITAQTINATTIQCVRPTKPTYQCAVPKFTRRFTKA